MFREPENITSGKYTRMFLAIAVVGLLIVLVAVISNSRGGGGDGVPALFDPATTDPTELRRVTEAVSRVIAAPASQHAAAVETMESVRVESAGARDLKESCVNTYRGLIRAQELMAQLEAIEIAPDGGLRRPEEIELADRAHASTLHAQASEQVELVTQSRDRCMDLYITAVRRLGMAPAQHP